MAEVTRRSFLLAAIRGCRPCPGFQPVYQVHLLGGFPADMPLPEAMRRAKDAGFQAFEIQMNKQLTPDTTPEELSRIRDGAHSTGLMIAAIWPSGFIRNSPLNSPDPAVRAKGVHAIKKALEFAVELQCEELLIVPGRVSLDGNEKRARAGYRESWDRTTGELRAWCRWPKRPKCLWDRKRRQQIPAQPDGDVHLHRPVPQPVGPVALRRGQYHAVRLSAGLDRDPGQRIKRVHLKDYKRQRAEQGQFVPTHRGRCELEGSDGGVRESGLSRHSVAGDRAQSERSGSVDEDFAECG